MSSQSPSSTSKSLGPCAPCCDPMPDVGDTVECTFGPVSHINYNFGDVDITMEVDVSNDTPAFPYGICIEWSGEADDQGPDENGWEVRDIVVVLKCRITDGVAEWIGFYSWLEYEDGFYVGFVDVIDFTPDTADCSPSFTYYSRSLSPK